MEVMHTQVLPGAAACPLMGQEPERVAQIDCAATVDASERSSARLTTVTAHRINALLRSQRRTPA